MSAKHVEQFVRRVEGNQLNLAFPGRFYVRPFVLARFANATFSFGAILRIEAVVPDGDIVSLVDPMYAYLVDQIRRDPTIIHRIDPRKWEEIVAAAYDRAGFDEVILTPRSGDHGRDVIAIKKGFGSVKFIDQVKAYKPGHVVTAAEVRELLGTLATEPSASKAILTTTSAFAPRIEDDQWIKPFLPTRLELVDKDKLIARLVGLEQSPTSAAPE
jgi:restriction system protein